MWAPPRGAGAVARLFEQGFTRELIALGMADTMARRDDVLAFFDWPRHAIAAADRDPSPTHWGGLDDADG